MEIKWIFNAASSFNKQEYYQNKRRFNGVCSRYNLSKKVKDEAHVINLDEYVDFGTYWIAYFELKSKLFILTVLELNMFLKKFKIYWLFRIQSNNSIMCRYFCIGFIDFMFAGKMLNFKSEINQRKLCNKKLNKYVAAFDYIDKILIVLSGASREVCFISSVSVVGDPIGIVGASFTLFFLTTRMINKHTGYNKKQKEETR